MFTLKDCSEDPNKLELELDCVYPNGKSLDQILSQFDASLAESVDIFIYHYDQSIKRTNIQNFEADFSYIQKTMIQNSLEEESNNISLKIFFNKFENEELTIISENFFIQSIPNDIKKLIAFWNRVFRDYKSLNISNYDERIEISSSGKVELKGTYSNNSALSSSTIFKPEDIWELLAKINKQSELFYHLTEVTVTYCLSLLANDIKIEDSEKYIFEGFGRTELTLNCERKYLQEFSDVLFTSYQFAFSDHHVSTKLGILRNVISLNTEKSIHKVFSRSFLKILFSNYQIYLQDNIHKYIEVKNKAVEIINNLNEKIIDNYYSFRKTARASTYAVFTFYFTFVITKLLSSEANSIIIIDFEVFSITSIFCIAAIAFIRRQSNELNQYYEFCKTRVSKIKQQYEGTLSDEERDEVFSEALLLKHNEIDLNHSEVYWYYGILSLLIVLTFVAALVNFLR